MLLEIQLAPILQIACWNISEYLLKIFITLVTSWLVSLSVMKYSSTKAVQTINIKSSNIRLKIKSVDHPKRSYELMFLWYAHTNSHIHPPFSLFLSPYAQIEMYTHFFCWASWLPWLLDKLRVVRSYFPKKLTVFCKIHKNLSTQACFVTLKFDGLSLCIIIVWRVNFFST